MFRPTLAVLAALALPVAAGARPLTLTPLGTFDAGLFRDEDPRVAEINAYDAAAHRIYVVNPFEGRLDVIDASDPTAPVATDTRCSTSCAAPRRRCSSRRSRSARCPT